MAKPLLVRHANTIALRFLFWMVLFLLPFNPLWGQTACSLNFDQWNGPSVTPFTGQTVRYGIVTVSGGALATNPRAQYSSVDPSTIYLTLMTDSNTLMDVDVGTYGAGYTRTCTNCQTTLTISFDQPVSNFSFTLYNGLAAWSPVYNVTVNGTLIQVATYKTICNSSAGCPSSFLTYPFPPSGSGIDSSGVVNSVPQPTSNISLLTITPGSLPGWPSSTYTDGAWDFFIDTISYNRPDNLPCDYVAPPPDPGPCDENQCESVAGQPINLSTGDVWISKKDYSVPGLAGGLSVTRTWNSLWNLNNPPFSAGMFGIGWTSDFEERLQVLSSTQIEYWRGSGNAWAFMQPGGCPSCAYSVVAPPNQHASLTYNTSTALYTLTLADGTKKTFNNSGYLTAVTDRNGNQTTITYDSSNRITKVTAPGGQSLTLSYGIALDPNRVTSIQDSVGTAATYSYSSSLLTQATYADGSQLNYAYDANNNVTSVTDSQAKILETHTYDGSGRGLTSSRANSVDSITIQYPSSGTTTLSDSNSNITTYTYSGIGGSNYMTGISGPGCDSCGGRNTQSFTLDASGNRLSATDANGNTISYTYDSNGNILTKTDAVGTWTYTYNGFSEVLTTKDPLGNTTTNVYDSNGNLTSTTTPSPDGGSTPGSKTSFTYDTKGELTTITDPLSNSTTLTYFSTGLINTIKDVQRNVTTYGYDARGNRTSVKDALNKTTAFTYDSMNRLKKITYPDNSTTQFAYDTRGRRTSVTDANNKTTSYTYDDADRLTQVTDPANSITAYAYDTESNLTGITDALTRATTFNYDSLGRVTKTTFPSYFIETYGYDNVGNLTSKTDRNGNTVTYTYDQLNRLKAKYYPDSTSVTYSYDNDSRLTQVQDPTGTYQMAYDNMGRVKQTTTNYTFLTTKTFTVSYGFDAGSNRTSMTDPENGATSYSYDSLNRLTTLAPPSAFGSGSFGFSYDALSRRTQLTRPNSVSTSYTYDSLSRLLSVTHAKHSTTLDGASYTMDAAGNRTSRTPLPSGTATNYSYDAIYELLTATQGSTTTESYSYDVVGNRLSSLGVSPYSYNTSNELTAKPGVTYTYDSNGNTLTKVVSSNTTTYAWDYENRLTSVMLPSSGGTVSFKHDPFGRRIEKISPTTTSIFAYDGNNLVEETNSSGAVVARYTQGTNIDEPLAMLRSAATSYYEADGLGSVTSLTNSAGATGQTYTYDSFGKVTASSGSLVNPFQYTGRELDSETGLYYYRARYYDSQVGKFISEDPLRFGADVNFYAYVRNDPINLIDPLGFSACKSATQNCLQRGLQALFPGAIAAVSDATAEVGGHWNFNVQLQFASYNSVMSFYNSYWGPNGPSQNGFGPPGRFGGGPAVHLENLSPTDTWLNSNGTSTVDGTAHIDLFNPNNYDVESVGGHVGVDGLIGHLAQAIGGNIDPARCPW